MPDKPSSAIVSAITKDIKVSVYVQFIQLDSSEEKLKYIWAYRIKIENLGAKTVQLMQRHWQIIDELGISTKISGNGVIGLNPVIEPGENFEYTSGTYLNAPSGVMFGKYEMRCDDDGSIFNVEIPPFSLDSPYSKLHLI
jgi:ApaG protein